LVRVGAVTAIVITALLLSTPALGASACASAVLRDWSDDGRVAPKYSLPCYEEAIDALPSDLRDYTNAEDVISRALTSAVRTSGPAQPAGDQSARSAPLPLVGLIAGVLATLFAGSVGYVVRRRRVVGGSDHPLH
jgi:hypothetical protein